MSEKIKMLVLLVFLILALVFLSPSKEPEFDAFGRANEAFNMGKYSAAAKMLEPLANEGDGRAAEYVAYLEAFGLGRPINRDKAKEWLTTSRGDQDAGTSECSIGVYWANGQFGKSNLTEAAYWIALSNNLQGDGVCLNSFQGKNLANDLRIQIENEILETLTE